MSNRNFLRLIVAATLLAVVSLCCFSIFYLSPAFNKLIIKNTEFEAIKVARHLSEPFRDLDTITRELPEGFFEMAGRAISDFGLMKIKVFAPDGETVYSTEQENVGEINERDYFNNIVARGGVFTKVVNKDAKSLEDQVVKVDVVETYVPIMHAGSFTGAFEIYFDITDTRNELRHLLITSDILLLLIAAGLMIVVLIISYIAGRSFVTQELAEKKIIQQSRDLQEKNNELVQINQEKLKLIDELQATISEIKTLRGIIPICMYCKKIRSDTGVWDQLEEYIRQHSDAEFSHGCCPECYKKLMEDLESKDDEK